MTKVILLILRTENLLALLFIIVIIANSIENKWLISRHKVSLSWNKYFTRGFYFVIESDQNVCYITVTFMEFFKSICTEFAILTSEVSHDFLHVNYSAR